MSIGHTTDCFYCPHRGRREPDLFGGFFASCGVSGKRVHFNNTGPAIECAHFERMKDPELMKRITEDHGNEHGN